MKIVINIFALAIMTVSLFFFVIGCFSTYKAEEYSHFILFSINAYNSNNPSETMNIDRSEWKKRWVITSITLVSYGFIGSISSIGILLKNRFAWKALISTLSIILIVESIMHYGMFYIYEFEKVDLIEIIILLILIIISLFFYKMSDLKTIK